RHCGRNVGWLGLRGFGVALRRHEARCQAAVQPQPVPDFKESQAQPTGEQRNSLLTSQMEELQRQQALSRGSCTPRHLKRHGLVRFSSRDEALVSDIFT
ncbi:unnamed protein product, partial [Symbiodinium sp. CCMP2592]